MRSLGRAAIEQPALTEQAVAEEAVASSYTYRVSWDEADPAWDAFLSGSCCGYYAQSCLWSRVKSMYGWRVLRVTASANGRLVGGVQVLTRRVLPMGGIGYAPRGPVMVLEDPALAAGLVCEMCGQVCRSRLYLLAVQPADPQFVPPMLDHGFRSTRREISPTYTLLLDLDDDPDIILSRMRRTTRQNIRASQRRGITVCEGGRKDLPTLHRLLRMTGERKQFKIPEQSFFLRIWDTFRPLGLAQLLLAEYAGEPVAAQLTLRFGETATNKTAAWSGEHGTLRPNHALQWAAILRAKEEGCRYYDFGGMSAKAARALLRGDPLPEALQGSVTSCKLGYGGRIVAYPGTYLYLGNPVLRWLERELRGSLEESLPAKRFLHHLRTR